jgi:hypothetical protein
MRRAVHGSGPGYAAMAGSVPWWRLGTSLLFPVLRGGIKVVRREGGVLVLVYAAYLSLLI